MKLRACFGVMLFLCTFAVLGGRASADTFVVDSVADTSDAVAGNGVCATAGAVCTLRAAIEESNALAGADTINFSIAGAGPHTISPASVLPTITTEIDLDGSTEPGASCGTLVPDLPSDSNTPHTLMIELDGSGYANDPIFELDTGAEGSSISGFVINGGNGGSGRGILVTDSGNISIECNYVGTNVAGSVADSNFGGVFFSGADGVADSTISNNLISGNTTFGVIVGAEGSTSNVIENNIIGLDATGTSTIPNTSHGVQFTFSSTGNTVRDNVISGNGSHGIFFSTLFSSADGNIAYGNFIGIDLAGTGDVGNTSVGVMASSNDNIIGGNSVAERNVISGNGTVGVQIGGTGTTVSGNYIGTDYSGVTAIPNTTDGVRHSSVGPSTIGGSTTAHRNIISGNGDDGIQTDSESDAGNATIQNNWIGVGSDGEPLGNGVFVAGNGIEIGWNDAGGNAIIDNVIADSAHHGVSQFGLNSDGDTFYGNFVGTNPEGFVEDGYGNTDFGISLWFGSLHIIGGDGDGQGNIIAGNGDGGVSIVGNSQGIEDFTGTLGFPGVQPNTPAEAVVVGNEIYANDNNGETGSGLAIDLMDHNYPDDFAGAGPNTNDNNDSDDGGNDYLNFIEVTSANNDDGDQTVNYELDAPEGSYLVEFFTNDNADSSGFGELQNFVHRDVISHDGNGSESFVAEFDNSDETAYISAVVTAMDGPVFEFSSEASESVPADSDSDSTETLADTGLSIMDTMLIGAVLMLSGTIGLGFVRRMSISTKTV